eukprot:CAMPEP_0206048376 /NCGR_PEP_ID=MMETSP1466-20131121/23937_1 /ASSEMBLY_ACC=CAM_ASM_001126 /TAXON_ID=44452 /ORGANISM="Pavlova gyrans, Strain CCMP608" /LENGTH=388 /DNA_ID=CAMNT_0053423427 /DNA_START=53 /DNA_END=1219 /DNA_ORIENTATION=-
MSLAMPLLIVNMGGEMVYILEQRLEAQSVPKEKGQRVLCDVTKTMYNPSFVNELFKPQDMYSIASVRQIFDRLAHSSIMRLNEASMDKLFDLMLMGFKYQLLSCTHPGELQYVTQNHLLSLAGKVGDDSVAQMVMGVSAKVMEVYGSMGPGEWGRLRRALCAFFQDKKVKVSLFLQDSIQRSDGTIAIVPEGLLPPNADVPGKVTYFNSIGGPQRTEPFDHPLAGKVQARTPGQEPEVSLGRNLYSKERASSGEASAAPPPASMPLPSAATSGVPKQAQPKHDSSEMSKQILSSERSAQARSELNALASLITAESAPSAPFKINLFPESAEPASGSGAAGKVQTIVIDFKGTDRRKDLDSMMSGMDVGGGGGGDGDDDLLDLMDKAGD